MRSLGMFHANLFILLAIVTAGPVLSGCAAEDPDTEREEIIRNLVQAGYPVEDIEIFDGKVYVQDDAHVTLEASREMLETSGTEEQYRTTNLVGDSVTKICVNPTAKFNNKSKLSAGLDLAIENYNELGLRITFERGPT